MSISQVGSLNTTALNVADLYVQIVPPQNVSLNGVPSGILGIVGSATWGPTNTPVTVSGLSDYQARFGTIQNRKFDLGTQVLTASMQGASDFRVVRVSDGTDAAATGAVVASCLTLTSKYTGTFGNGIQAQVLAGAKANSFKLVIGAPGLQNEVFDNITGSGNGFWLAAQAAVNNGSGDGLRGPSQIVVASAGAGTTAAAAQSSPVTLTGGADGATSVTSSTLIGADTASRTGMYALRGTGASVLVLADSDDSTQYTTQAAFALDEGMYVVLTGPSGDNIANAVSTKATAGLDSWPAKLMFGDWIYFNDPVNKLLRLVSPQGFAAGRLANLSPEQSSLNKPLYGVVGSQKSGAPGAGSRGRYSRAELSQMASASIDVIANPAPGGNYWAVREGINSSTNAGTRGDNYTRLTNYIAATLNTGMGQYVGQTINQALFRRVKATLTSFLQNLLGQGVLGSLDGSLPFSVVCDLTNNPLSRTSLGYLQADVQVQYQAIVFYFIVNLEGGQTVTVSRQTLPTGQVS